jgi:hypothetical protein
MEKASEEVRDPARAVGPMMIIVMTDYDDYQLHALYYIE